ncbi:hypothetical protein EJB05_33565, partial [Eragrostis curvula]
PGWPLGGNGVGVGRDQNLRVGRGPPCPPYSSATGRCYGMTLSLLTFVIRYMSEQAMHDQPVAREEMRKEVLHKKPLSEVSNREAIKKVDIKQEVGIDTRLKNNGSGFSLEDYLAEMTKVAAAQKRAREVSHKTVNEVTDMDVMTEEDEAAMKARFEDWMKEYGRTYKSEEEKARRYNIFKSFAKIADKATANARGGARFVTNHTADWTDEEFRCVYGVGIDWDDYLDDIKYFIDKKRAKTGPSN